MDPEFPDWASEPIPEPPQPTEPPSDAKPAPDTSPDGLPRLPTPVPSRRETPAGAPQVLGNIRLLSNEAAPDSAAKGLLTLPSLVVDPPADIPVPARTDSPAPTSQAPPASATGGKGAAAPASEPAIRLSSSLLDEARAVAQQDPEPASLLSPPTVIYEPPPPPAAKSGGSPPAAGTPAPDPLGTVNLDRPAELAALEMSAEPAAPERGHPPLRDPEPAKAPLAAAPPSRPAAVTVVRPPQQQAPGAAPPFYSPPTLMVDADSEEPIRPRERRMPELPAWAAGPSTTTARPAPPKRAPAPTIEPPAKPPSRPASTTVPTNARHAPERERARGAGEAKPSWRRSAFEESGQQPRPQRASWRNPEKPVERPRRRARPRSWLTVALVFLLLVFAGAVALSRLVSLDQRANLENNARDLLQQTAGKVSSRLDDWRSTRKRFQPAQEVVDAPQVERPAPTPPEPAAKPVRAPARTRARAATGKQVTVYLDSIPTGATVIGPDGPLGTTPLSHRLPLQSTATFTFTADGFETVSRTVKATKRFDSVMVKLPSKRGD